MITKRHHWAWSVWAVVLGLIVAWGTAHAQSAPILTVNGTVQRPDGTPASGLSVTVENTTRGVQETETTAADGSYSVTIVDFSQFAAGSVGDTIVVTVEENGVPVGTASYQLQAGDVDEGNLATATINVTLSGVVVQFAVASLPGDGVASTTITVTVTDQQGQPVTGDTLTATADLGTVGPFTDQGDGSYTATYTAPISSTDRNVFVRVTSQALNAEGVGRITILGVPSNVQVEVNPPQLVADGSSTATVTVTITRNNNPVTDEVVTLTASAGTVGDVTNNGDGTYTAVYTAGTTAGLATITATATNSGAAGTGVVELIPGPPVAVASVTPAATTLSGNGTSTTTVTAIIVDANDNPVPGVSIVTASVSGPGSVSPVEDLGNGSYQVTYTSGVVTAPSVATVTFSFEDADGNVQSGSATIQLTPEPPAETNTLVVAGTIYREGGTVPAPDGLVVTVRNTANNLSQESTSGATGSGTGGYSVVFFDPLQPIAESAQVIVVEVRDEDGVVRGTASHALLASEVEAGEATVDVTTDIPVTSQTLTVVGTVTYDDGETPILADLGLQASVTVNGFSDSAEVGNAGPGQFSVAFVSLEEPLRAGQTITVQIAQDGNVVGDLVTEATPEMVANSLAELVVPTTIKPSNVVFSVSGSVVPAPGVDPAPSGTIVQVTNRSRPGVMAAGDLGSAGPNQFSVALVGDFIEPVVVSGDLLTIEVIAPNGDILATEDVELTAQQVLDASLEVELTLSGILLTVDAPPEVLYDRSGVASATITATAVRPDGTPADVPVSFTPSDRFSAPVILGGGRVSATFRNSYATNPILGEFPIRVVAGPVSRTVRLNLVDRRVPTILLDPPQVTTLVGREVTLTATVQDNIGLQSVEWDLGNDGTVDARGDTFRRTFTQTGTFGGTITARDVAGNVARLAFTIQVTQVTVGGLAIDLPNYIRLIQNVLDTATDAPNIDEETRAFIKTMIPTLIRDGSLLGVPVPIFPPTLTAQPTKPTLVPDPSGLDLENFGNPLFVPLADAAAEDPTGILRDALRVPLAVVGNRLQLYIRAPLAQEVSVLLQSSTQSRSFPAELVTGGSFEAPFVLDEALALFFLPGWPGSMTQPFSSVTLRIADNPSGPYSSVPMARDTVVVDGQEQAVWRTTQTLQAGKAYYYYYEIQLTQPLTVGGTFGSTPITRWAMPDIRNLQFVDRGFAGASDPELQIPFLDAVALRLQPVVGSLLAQVEEEAIRLAEEAGLNDPEFQQQIINDPDVQALLLDRVQNDPNIQQLLLNDPQIRQVLINRLSTDVVLQDQLIEDPEVRDLMLQQPAVQAAQERIAQEVVEELVDDPRVQAAFEEAFQEAFQETFEQTLAQTGDPQQAQEAAQAAGQAAGEAAAQAKIEELAPPLVEARLLGELPDLLVDVADAILPVVAPVILPLVAPDVAPLAADIILPFIQADLQAIIVAKYGPQFVQQAINNVIGDPTDLAPRVLSAVQPLVNKVLNYTARTGEIPIVSKLRAPTAGALWIATVDLESVSDGDYMVQVQVDGGELFANAKPIRIDRSAGTVQSLTVTPLEDAGMYTREDGVLVAAPLAEGGALRLSAEFTGDALGGIFQQLGVEEDPVAQARRLWVPVNQTAILLASALKNVAPDADEEQLYDFALLAVVVTDPGLIAKLRALDEEGIDRFLAGYSRLSPAKRAQVELLGQAVRSAVLNGNTSALTSLLSLDFAALSEYANLVAQIRLIPGYAGLSGRVTMAFPPAGQYYLRAVAVDQYLNVSTQVQPIRLDIVEPEADLFRISRLSLGDVNGNGVDTDPFETVEVDETGQVDPDAFRIWANTQSVAVTILAAHRTVHPLNRVALELSIDGKSWSEIGTLSAEQLAAVQAGDTFEFTLSPDVATWLSAGVESVQLRVVAQNALTVIGTSPTVALTVDSRPLAIEPEVVAFTVQEAEGFTVSPDSGGYRGTLEVSVRTPAFTLPPIGSVRIEISTDGGATFVPLTPDLGGAESGAAEQVATEATSNAADWLLSWDTTQVPDTVENVEPENRDATQDDNPYQLRAVLLAEDGSELLTSDVITVPVDNVDDVPPITSTQIVKVEREGRAPDTWEDPTLNADGQPILRAQARFTVEVSAPFETIAGGKVQLFLSDPNATIGDLIGEADVVEGQTSYQFVVDTRAVPNGIYYVLALVQDAAGNLEVPTTDQVLAVEVANITIPKIVIRRVGVLDTNRDVTLRRWPVSGTVVFEVEAPGAEAGGLFHAADPAQLSEDLLRLAELPVPPDADGLFRFELDVSSIPDGPYFVRFGFGASPTVFSDVIELLVDNTPPEVEVLAPIFGEQVGVRPILWARYQDASGIAIGGLTLRGVGGVVLDQAVGEPDQEITGELSPVEGLTFRADEVVYQTPNENRLASGPYVFDVAVTDLAGNAASVSSRFTVAQDIRAPQVHSFAPTGTTFRLRPEVTITFTDDIAGVSAANVSVALSDAEGAAVPGSLVVQDAAGNDAGAAAILSGRAVFTPDVDLSAGEYLVNAVISDTDGNATPVTWSFVVERDVQAPAVVAVSPQGTVVGPDVTLVVSFQDESAVTVQISVDGGAARNAQVVDNSRARLSVTLDDGLHTAVATLVDEHGNRSSVEWSFAVEVDTEAPLVATVSPQGTVNSSAVVLVVAFSDASAVTVQISVDGGAARNAQVVDNSRARLSVTLDDGLHTAVATLVDEHGNRSSVEWSFLVKLDTTPPVVASFAPTSFVGSRRPVIAATFSDDRGVDVNSIELRLDGQSVTPTAVDATSLVYEPNRDLTTGTHRVRLTLADTSGNEASAEWEFAIETTPPSVSSVVPLPGSKIRGNAEVRAAIVVTAFYQDAESGVDAGSVSLSVTLDGQEVAGQVEASTTAASWRPAAPLAAGVYDVQLTVSDQVGNATEYSWSFIVEEEQAVVRPPRIVPNPFADETAVWIGLGQEATLSVRIYDFNQRLVATVPNQLLLPGIQRISLAEAIAPLARGVYFCQILVDTGEQQPTVRVLKMAKVR